MTRKWKNKRLLNALLTLLLLVLVIIGGAGYIPAFADTLSTTSALTDLQKDSDFKADDYSYIANDYSMQVIQIAESGSASLYLYIYQPSQLSDYLVATEINMSLSESVDETKLYGLKLINTYGVFSKYLVKDIKVSNDATRYYNITSVYRAWVNGIDEDTGNDNIINSKYFKVGKLFKAETVDGYVKYSCKNVDTVEIKSPFVDFVSYGQQSGWDYIFGVTKWTDIHYVAFSTDKKIDTLKEADVTYTTQSYHFTEKDGKGYTYGEKSEPQYLTLTGEEEIGIDGYKQYTWKSIYRMEDFVKTTNLTGEAKTQVEKSEFVLVFLKTSFKEQEKYSMMQGHYKEADGTKVSDVAILRLEFETNGVCYNLGALMDKQEGDDVAGNKPLAFDFWQWLADVLGVPVWVTKLIVYGVVVLAVLGIALPILSIFFPIVGIILKAVLNAVIFIISAPFKFVAWVFRKCRGE